MQPLPCQQVENRLRRGLHRRTRKSTPVILFFLGAVPFSRSPPCRAKLPPSRTISLCTTRTKPLCSSKLKVRPSRFILHLVCFQQRLHAHPPPTHGEVCGFGELRKIKQQTWWLRSPKFPGLWLSRNTGFVPSLLRSSKLRADFGPSPTTGSGLRRDHHHPPDAGLQRAGALPGDCPRGSSCKSRGTNSSFLGTLASFPVALQTPARRKAH